MSLISSSLVMVYVKDMDRAIDFYTNKLGFTQKVRYGNDWAEIEAPELRIALHPVRDKPMEYAHNMQIGFAVPDMKKAIADLRAKGVNIEEYNGDAVQLAPFTDDDGNQMYLYAPWN